MATAEQEQTVRRFMAALESSGDLGVLHDLCEEPVATEWQALMEDFAFTERTFTVDQTVVDGARVAILWTISGRHTGEFNGLPATGRRTSNTGSAFFTFTGGRISELVVHYDADGLYDQLGATVTLAD
ncbi:conserved hypothetical protein, steroid delta-isomerase-related [Friedmanniella luteola]|uniref:SnoaL-like polyketide cyclase n=1 Tax=Friedmanniella luteola TaxID=546871 RepID=A0A1H1T7U9_9ACTN|nr:ester cyclase [Friedmanniella luteola]SDS56277.1 conserved hypothetical protein, steroid delta-isomerase-related [Friedmanniella luteola]